MQNPAIRNRANAQKELGIAMKKATKIVSTVLVLAFLATGCTSPNYQANRSAYNGAAIGAATGAALAAVLGNNIPGLKDDRNLMIPLGALGGGLLGGSLGTVQDGNRAVQNNLQNQLSTTMVQVNNSNGSFTPVILRANGYGGWIGPQGEVYQTLPTESQLRGIYGLK